MHTKPFNESVYLVSPELREKTPSVKSVLLAGNPSGAAKTNMKKKNKFIQSSICQMPL